MRTREEALKYLKENFRIEDFTAPINTYFKLWLDELDKELLEQEEKVNRILEGLLKADRIYTVAMGRSELMARSTGMRWMHEGFGVHRIGESYTPAIGNDPNYKDVVFFVSGSGETDFVITAEKRAKENKVPIFGVSSNRESEAVTIAGEENVIITKGKKIYSKDSLIPPEYEEAVNFLQTKSEIKAFYVGELLVNYVAKAKGISEADMEKRHANT